MCLVAQSQVFQDGEELFLKMMGISVSAKQIQRVSECYGEHIEADHIRYIETGDSPPSIADKKEDTVYVMVDGSMLFTREEGVERNKSRASVFRKGWCASTGEKK